MSHWHVSVGSTGGYFVTEVSPPLWMLEDVADTLHEQLRLATDAEYEYVHALGQTGAYAQAWAALLRYESLAAMTADYSPSRRDAPLYRGDMAAWRVTVQKMLQETGFPVRFNGDREAIFVTECDETMCDQHMDYPHEPGRLHDCPACEQQCHCTPDTTPCVHCALDTKDTS